MLWVSNNYFLPGSNNALNIVNENLAYGPQEKIESEAYKQRQDGTLLSGSTLY